MLLIKLLFHKKFQEIMYNIVYFLDPTLWVLQECSHTDRLIDTR